MLEICNLSVRFTRYARGIQRHRIQPIRELDLTVEPGQLVAVVGESGAGKSLLALAVMGLLPGNAEIQGTLRYKGEALTPSLQKRLRGRDIALIPQSVGSLDPLMPIGRQVERAARLSGLDANRSRMAADRALARYSLSKRVKRLFPFQLSGGMARRALTATATAGRASLILADEPTSGLDPENLGVTVGHLRRLADAGKAVVMITHDLEAALDVADRVAVFCAGTTVEILRPEAFAAGNLRHPYTRALWQALPQNSFQAGRLHPDPKTDGCPFHASCRQAQTVCRCLNPTLLAVPGGWARCHYA